MAYQKVNFGAWLKQLLTENAVDLDDFARDAGMLYASLNRLMNNSGKDGEPITPKPETVEKVALALVKNKLVAQKEEVYIAAGGQMPDGFLVVRDVEYQRLSVATKDDPIDSIIYESGISEDVPADEVDDLRQEVKDYIKMRVERMKNKQGKRNDDGKSQN